MPVFIVQENANDRIEFLLKQCVYVVMEQLIITRMYGKKVYDCLKWISPLLERYEMYYIAWFSWIKRGNAHSDTDFVKSYYLSVGRMN